MLATCLPFRTEAQPAKANPSNFTSGEESGYSIRENGPHHRIWNSVVAQTNELGTVSFHTNAFTELATGLNHLVGGQWVESTEDIQLTPVGGAATNTQHQVFFSANINTPGSIDLVTPHGRHLTGTVLGLSLYDTTSGQNSIIAQVQDSIGEISGNQVLYTNALIEAQSDFQADVLYTHKRTGFEQDVILHQQPPSPASFGLNPDTTMLQVWTEFYNTADPETTTNAIAVSVTDNGRASRRMLGSEILNFGSMQMDQGNAFVSGATNEAEVGSLLLIPVAKHWIRQGTRRFLVEEIPFNSIVQQLSTLPATVPSGSGAGGANSPQSSFREPVKSDAKEAKAQTLRLAKQDHSTRPSLVLDYVTLINNVTNYTFQSDTTYYVSGPLNLYGLTTVEGGTVVKSATTSSGTTIINGDVKWLTAPYRPAIFTSTNDNSVGVSLPGSTGTPVLGQTSYLYAPGASNISNVRFSYAFNAYSAGGSDVEIRDCQFIKCSHPISVNTGTTKLGLHNVLMTMDPVLNGPGSWQGGGWGITVYSTGLVLSGEHVTADLGSHNFIEYTSSQLSSFSLTNSIIQAQSLLDCTSGTSTATLSTNQVYYSSSVSTTLFQTNGAGNYYLTTNSPYRGIGTTNINATALTDIQIRTTYPPVYLTNTLTNDTILNPQAPRDTNSSLDLGYHYFPIDFLSACTVTNATLLLTNGVVLGYYSEGISLRDGSQLVSQGSPTQRNYIVHASLVQEQSSNLWSPNAINLASPFYLSIANNVREPGISMRFTTLSLQSSISYGLYAVDSGAALGNLTLRDCEIYAAGGNWYVITSTNFTSVYFQNNLVHRAGEMWVGTPAQITTYNNLFIGGTNAYVTNIFTYGVYFYNSSGTSNNTNKDNAYDGVDAYVDGVYTNNAFLNGTYNEMGVQTGDIVANLTWAAGPLGSYYQATNTLVNKGNTTADLLGLYHYTTQTNQMKETNSVVDIGYHYVALTVSGQPDDSDGDGLPDYLEDSNGNGVYDFAADLGNWQASSTCGDGVSDYLKYIQGHNPNVCTTSNDISGLLFLQVYTPLK